MNLYLLWESGFYHYISLSGLFVLTLVLSSYFVKNIWIKRFARYYSPVSLLLLDNFFYYFVRTEESRIRISEFHRFRDHFIDSKLDNFFISIFMEIFFFAVLSFLFFSLFKLFEKVFHKLCEKSN